MPPSLLISGSAPMRIRLTQAVLLLFLFGLGGLVLLQSWLNDDSKQLVPSTGTSSAQQMQGYVNDIAGALADFLQSHDRGSLERIKTAGRDARQLLERWKSEATANPPELADVMSLEQDHEKLRTAVLGVLEIDTQYQDAKKAVQRNQEGALKLFMDDIEPSIRSNQLNASSKKKAVAEAIAEVRALGSQGGDIKALGFSHERFRKAVEAYERLARSRRASRWSDQARAYFDDGASQIRKSVLADKGRQEALSNFSSIKSRIDQELVEAGAVVEQSPPSFRASLRQKPWFNRFIFTVMGLILFLGAFLILKTGRDTEKRLIAPIVDVLQCVEAASSGDVSRVPQIWSRDEMGQLSQAVGRMINVLARSENLVYHLAALVESSGEAIISHTLDGTILSWNKGAQRIYGFAAEEIKGQPISVLSPYDQGREIMAAIERVRQGERIQPFETVQQAKNGRTVKALVRVSAIFDSTRKVIGASFCAQELTDTNLLKPRAVSVDQTV